MSIEKTATGDWRVRWREAGRNRSRIVGRKRDAEAFDAEMRRRRRMGEIASFDGGKMLLADFAREEWWPDWAEPNLAPSTLQSYAGTWDKHVLPRVGGIPLRELTLPVCQRFASDLVRDGVGPATRHRAIVLLGSVMQRAVEWGRIPANPVRSVRKPPQRREREVRPLSPASVEALRAQMGPRDAALVSVLAYVGPRPAEALRLRWSDVGDRSVRFHATKTRTRRVRAARAHGAGPAGPRGLAAAQCTADRRRARVPSPGRRRVAQGRLEQLAQPGVPAGADRRRPARRRSGPTTYATQRPASGCTRAAASSRWPSGWVTRRPCRSTPTAT